MKPKEYKPVKVGIVVGKMVGGGVESVVLNLLKFNDSGERKISCVNA
ncbi:MULTISPECIES: hypothetical protein [Lactiplantibacillus]|nr:MULTISPECIES: hypothetical protein [Lactiplantibacillus]MBU7530881.1 hypothetical protein [Lactiplantibacillus pentosus]MDF3265842.1 hypothetical protein [Lactiplantibacillus plantarum]